MTAMVVHFKSFRLTGTLFLRHLCLDGSISRVRLERMSINDIKWRSVPSGAEILLGSVVLPE